VVPAHGHKVIDVRLVIDPAKLPVWTLNLIYADVDGPLLSGVEYDGYITLTAGGEKLSVPWHVLPRRAAATEAQWIDKRGSSLSVYLNNPGHELGQYELYSLMGTSPRLPASALPKPGDNFAAVDLRAVGVRFVGEDVCFSIGGCLDFAISTHGRRAHPAYPAGFEIDIDTNGDGVIDYFVFNGEDGGFATTGQTLIYVQKVTESEPTAYYYADADLNSANMVMTVPISALGLKAGDTIDFSAVAYDNYFSFMVSDEITGMRFTPGAARFNAAGLPFGDVPAKTGGRIEVSRAGVGASKSSESGLLFMYRRNARREADILPAN
jgi:minor extracellular serine protease Vpr